MECGLSSTPTTQDRDRPTDLRHLHHTRMAGGRQMEIGNGEEGQSGDLTRELTVLKRGKYWRIRKKTLE